MGCTLGQEARKEAFFVFSRQPSGPRVTMARDTPNSFRSLSAPSSGVQFHRNSTSLSLIFTTSACRRLQSICSRAASSLGHRGLRRFGSQVMSFPFSLA